MVVICISNAIKLKNIFPKMLTLVITQWLQRTALVKPLSDNPNNVSTKILKIASTNENIFR
jgi:hypothetical protein